jgi:hypothetical protein
LTVEGWKAQDIVRSLSVNSSIDEVSGPSSPNELSGYWKNATDPISASLIRHQRDDATDSAAMLRLNNNRSSLTQHLIAVERRGSQSGNLRLGDHDALETLQMDH